MLNKLEFSIQFINLFYKFYTTWMLNQEDKDSIPHFHIRVSKYDPSRKFGKSIGISYSKDGTNKKIETDIPSVQEGKIKTSIVVKEITKKTSSTFQDVDDFNILENKKINKSKRIEEKVEVKEVITLNQEISEDTIKIPDVYVDFWDHANLSKLFLCELGSGRVREYQTSDTDIICFKSSLTMDQVGDRLSEYHKTGDKDVLFKRFAIDGRKIPVMRSMEIDSDDENEFQDDFGVVESEENIEKEVIFDKLDRLTVSRQKQIDILNELSENKSEISITEFVNTGRFKEYTKRLDKALTEIWNFREERSKWKYELRSLLDDMVDMLRIDSKDDFTDKFFDRMKRSVKSIAFV